MVSCTNNRFIHFSFLSVAHNSKFNESVNCEWPFVGNCVTIFKFSYYIEVAFAFMAIFSCRYLVLCFLLGTRRHLWQNGWKISQTNSLWNCRNFLLDGKRPCCRVNPNHSFGKSVCSLNDMIIVGNPIQALFLLIEGFRITFMPSGKRQIGSKWQFLSLGNGWIYNCTS